MTLNDASLASLEPRLRTIISESVAADGIPFRARTAHFHTTWARTFSSLPELYIQPASVAEVEKAVRLARLCRRRITTVGHAHSPSDLTCTASWLVNLDRLNRVLSIDSQSGLVETEAGIRLCQLTAELRRVGLSFPILPSVDEQTIAGAISTGTRGSSLQQGLMSEAVVGIRITLADGTTVACSATNRPDLFRGALLSLGALGVLVQITFRAVPAFLLRWTQTIQSDAAMLAMWRDANRLWTQGDFVRVWWLPYTRRAVVWSADIVAKEDLAAGRATNRDPVPGYYDGPLGYHLYHSLLWLSRYIPRLVPWIEWFIFGMQYGFKNGMSTTATQPMDRALTMNCLFSQYVTEWAVPLHRGTEALMRLGSWLNRLKPGDALYVEHGMPYDADTGLFVHAPIEVRVCDSTVHTSPDRNNRPYLDSTVKDGPTLNINAIMYRPYDRDPAQLRRWFDAFEWLMRDLGGKPHWAKNFAATKRELEQWYGDDLEQWRRVRRECDPDGLFVAPWHLKHVIEDGTGID